jgi:ankyrin repeat protein
LSPVPPIVVEEVHVRTIVVQRGILCLILAAVLGGLVVAQTIPPIEAEETPLHWAADHGMTTIAARLIENGADVDAVDQFGRTPLHRAVAYSDVVSLLIQSGADVNAADIFGRTALHEALQYPDTVAILISAGADIFAQDYMGDTPLERTLRYGTRSRNLVVINLLLDAGAGDPSAQ